MMSIKAAEKKLLCTNRFNASEMGSENQFLSVGYVKVYLPYLARCVRHWNGVTDSGKVCQTLERCHSSGKVCQTLERCRRPWEGVTDSGKV